MYFVVMYGLEQPHVCAQGFRSAPVFLSVRVNYRIIGAQSCTPNAKGRSAGGMAFTRDKC